MKKLVSLLVQAIAVFVTAYILPGVYVDGFVTAFVVAVVLALLNLIVKPILVFFTFPITVLTLGLFYFVINALLIILAAAIVPGFVVHGIITALLFSILLSLVRSVLDAFAR